MMYLTFGQLSNWIYWFWIRPTSTGTSGPTRLSTRMIYCLRHASSTKSADWTVTFMGFGLVRVWGHFTYGRLSVFVGKIVSASGDGDYRIKLERQEEMCQHGSVLQADSISLNKYRCAAFACQWFQSTLRPLVQVIQTDPCCSKLDPWGLGDWGINAECKFISSYHFVLRLPSLWFFPIAISPFPLGLFPCSSFHGCCLCHCDGPQK